MSRLILSIFFMLIVGIVVCKNPLVSLHLARSVCKQQNDFSATGKIQASVKNRIEYGPFFGCIWYHWDKSGPSFRGEACESIGVNNTAPLKAKGQCVGLGERCDGFDCDCCAPNHCRGYDGTNCKCFASSETLGKCRHGCHKK